MAFIQYDAYKYNSTSGLVKLNDIQSFSVQHGRQWPTDPYAPMSMTLRARGTAQAVIGDRFAVTYISDTFFTYFGGQVKDVKVNYGNLPSMDTTDYSIEGPLAVWGRKDPQAVAVAQAKTLAAINTAATSFSIAAPISVYGTGQSTISAMTYTGNALDWLNTVMQTEMGHVVDSVYISAGPPKVIQFDVAVYQRNYDQIANYTFADDSTADGVRYNAIEFTSAAQAYYTSATIQPQGLATQVAGSGAYNITQDSYDYTTGQALAHAQYIVATYNNTTSKPMSITASYANQDTATRQTKFKNLLFPGNVSGALIKIIFRGNTYYAITEGRDVTVDQSDTTITYYLSPFDNNNYLILDNAVFGTLDSNKLGF